MKPHNQHQLQEAIISFLKEHPERHSVIDVHFGISDYFADHCYKYETARTLWKLSEDGTIKYKQGFFFPLPANHQTTMTNLNPPTLTREQINCQIRKLKEASPDQSINGMQGWMLSFEEIDSLVKWAADMELEACCEWFREFYKTESWGKSDLEHFRAARRPKPPSEKEQALEALERIDMYAVSQMRAYTIHDDLIEDIATIRRALGAIPTDAQ